MSFIFLQFDGKTIEKKNPLGLHGEKSYAHGTMHTIK